MRCNFTITYNKNNHIFEVIQRNKQTFIPKSAFRSFWQWSRCKHAVNQFNWRGPSSNRDHMRLKCGCTMEFIITLFWSTNLAQVPPNTLFQPHVTSIFQLRLLLNGTGSPHVLLANCSLLKELKKALKIFRLEWVFVHLSESPEKYSWSVCYVCVRYSVKHLPQV